MNRSSCPSIPEKSAVVNASVMPRAISASFSENADSVPNFCNLTDPLVSVSEPSSVPN
jgi:hypothetical protein